VNNLIHFESETFDKDIIISGNLSGLLNVSVNKKDMDTDISVPGTAGRKTFLLSTHTVRASYAKNNEVRQLLQPNKMEQIPIRQSIFTSKKVEKGSRLLLLVGISKNPNWQLNYGTGKDVSDETIKDAGEPMVVKWYNDSYVEIPVYKD
jgi:hypothetical protein